MADEAPRYEFGRGFAVPGQRAYFFSYPADEPDRPEDEFTRVVCWSPSEIATLEIPWVARGLCFVSDPAPHMLIVGRFGEVYVFARDGTTSELIDFGDFGPSGRGELRDARAIDQRAFACGMGRQVYRRTCAVGALNGQWQRWDSAIARPVPDDQALGINSIDGFSENEIYGVGWKGEIWLYKDNQWSSVPSPTNVKLNRIVCAPDGGAYAAGQGGVLLRGRGEQWEIIDHQETEDQIWGIEWFSEKVWLSTGSTVYSLEPDISLKPIARPVPDITCHWLSAADGRLWSIGKSHVCYTDDGTTWTLLHL